MSRQVKWLLGIAVVLLAIGVPLAYSAYYGTHFRNFRIMEDGVLYRSGQLTPHGLDTIVKEHGIRTVISLRTSRDPNKPHPDTFEEDYCNSHGMKFVRLIPKVWSVQDGKVPAQVNVDKFLEVMNDKANHPVLIHCFAGIHRTGTFCTIYRMEYNGWSSAEALAELRSLGYENVDDHVEVVDFLTKYKPQATK